MVPEEYEALARDAEAAGVDVLSVYHDLLDQPAIGPHLLMRTGTATATIRSPYDGSVVGHAGVDRQIPVEEKAEK